MNVSIEKVEDMLRVASKKIYYPFEKTIVIAVKLANGFVLTESFSVMDAKNFNAEAGERICMNRIKNRLCELESYYLQENNYCTEKAVNEINKTSEPKKVKITDELAEEIHKEFKDMTRASNYNLGKMHENLNIIVDKYNVDKEELLDKLEALANRDAEKAAALVGNIFGTFFA